jgi:hypothetical protein
MNPWTQELCLFCTSNSGSPGNGRLAKGVKETGGRAVGEHDEEDAQASLAELLEKRMSVTALLGKPSGFFRY